MNDKKIYRAIVNYAFRANFSGIKFDGQSFGFDKVLLESVAKYGKVITVLSWVMILLIAITPIFFKRILIFTLVDFTLFIFYYLIVYKIIREKFPDDLQVHLIKES